MVGNLYRIVGGAGTGNAGEARLAFVLLLAGAACIAFSPIFVRLSEAGPTATAFWRCALAVPALYVWLMRAAPAKASGTAGGTSRRDFAILALAGAFFAGDLGFWHLSIMFTSVANATLLANVAPLFVTLGAFLLFRERFSRLFLLGLALAIAGAVVLMGQSLTVSPPTFGGDLLGVTTAVFYAGYILVVGRLRARLSTRTVMFWTTLVSAILLWPAALASGEAILPASALGWLNLVALALVSQALGQGLIAYALAHLPAAFSSVSLLTQPVLAALLAWVLFGEALGAVQGLGALGVLLGIAFARKGSRGADKSP
jgi:drug/metabolite transporter (DMT)-like permease